MANAAISFDDLIPAQGASAPVPQTKRPTLTPVDHDPFAAAPKSQPTLTPVDYDPWAQYVTPQTAAPVAANGADPWAQYVTPAAQPSASPAAPPQEPAPGPMRGADDIVRLLANGMTFGLADKAASYLTGTTPQQEAQHTADSLARTGKLGTAASIGGALLPALAGGGAVSAGADALAGVPVLGRVAGNTLVQGATTGAGLGAADAAAHGQPVGTGAAIGAAGGAGGAALGGAVARGAGFIGSLFVDPPPVMSSTQLQQAAQGAYRDAENAGVVYSPDAVDRLRGAVQSNMADFGYAPELQPGGAAVLRSLDRSDGTPTTLAGIDTTRKIAGNMFAPTNPSSTALGGRIKGVIDDFTANPRPGDIMMGDADGGVQALTDARRLYNMLSKDQDLSDALVRAQQNAGASGSGGNINNATRQAVKGVLQSRGDWTPDETAALNSIVTGTPTSNMLRQVGKLSPEGNGLLQILNLGAVAAEPKMAVVPGIGFLAKRAGDAATARAVQNAGELIRAGGNVAATQMPPSLVQQFAARSGQPISALTLGSLYAEPNQ